jgi:hypothetical protein
VEIALVGLVSAVVSALVSAGIAYLSHRELLGVKMVEIAVGILAHEPDAKNKALRAWVQASWRIILPRPCLLLRKRVMSYEADGCPSL